MKKIWGKDYGGSFGLGRKSSGTDTDTETWSQFRLPIPKPGFGSTLLWPPQKLLENIALASNTERPVKESKTKRLVIFQSQTCLEASFPTQSD